MSIVRRRKIRNREQRCEKQKGKNVHTFSPHGKGLLFPKLFLFLTHIGQILHCS